MAHQGELQIAVPRITELDIVFAYASIVNVKTFTEVKVSLHVSVIKENVLYKVTDKVTCPIKWRGVLVIIKIIIKIDMQLFDSPKLDVMMNTVSNIYDNDNTDKCGAVKVTMYAGHKNRS